MTPPMATQKTTFLQAPPLKTSQMTGYAQPVVSGRNILRKQFNDKNATNYMCQIVSGILL